MKSREGRGREDHQSRASHSWRAHCNLSKCYIFNVINYYLVICVFLRYTIILLCFGIFHLLLINAKPSKKNRKGLSFPYPVRGPFSFISLRGKCTEGTYHSSHTQLNKEESHTTEHSCLFRLFLHPLRPRANNLIWHPCIFQTKDSPGFRMYSNHLIW